MCGQAEWSRSFIRWRELPNAGRDPVVCGREQVFLHHKRPVPAAPEGPLHQILPLHCVRRRVTPCEQFQLYETLFYEQGQKHSWLALLCCFFWKTKKNHLLLKNEFWSFVLFNGKYFFSPTTFHAYHFSRSPSRSLSILFSLTFFKTPLYPSLFHSRLLSEPGNIFLFDFCSRTCWFKEWDLLRAQMNC